MADSSESSKAQKRLARDVFIDISDDENERPRTKKQKPLGFDDDIVTNPNMLMACASRSCKEFKELFKGMEALVDSAVVYFRSATQEGDPNHPTPAHMMISTLDTAHVSLTHVVFNEQAFSEGFVCERDLAVGLNFKSLSDLFKLQQKDDAVAFQVPTDVSFNVIFNTPGEKSTIGWELHQLDINCELMDMSKEMNHTNQISMPTKLFKLIIKRLSARCESFGIDTSAGSATFWAKSEEIRSIKQTVINGEGGVEIIKHDPHPCTYSLLYMAKFAQLCSVSDRITIAFGGGAPLCITCTILDGHASIKQFLSPKTEDQF